MALIKAAAYALLGFVLYEFFLGITQGVEKQGSGSQKRQLKRAMNEDRGRMKEKGQGARAS